MEGKGIDDGKGGWQWRWEGRDGGNEMWERREVWQIGKEGRRKGKNLDARNLWKERGV